MIQQTHADRSSDFRNAQSGAGKNWLIFYPVEKFLAHWTDMLVTINQEDYQVNSKRYIKQQKTEVEPIA